MLDCGHQACVGREEPLSEECHLSLRSGYWVVVTVLHSWEEVSFPSLTDHHCASDVFQFLGLIQVFVCPFPFCVCEGIVEGFGGLMSLCAILGIVG